MPSRTPDDAWLAAYHRLLEFVDAHGHARVPRSCRTSGFHLGLWAYRQRASHTAGTLAADRQRYLERIPTWTWRPADAQWQRYFDALCRHVHSGGDANVPHSATVDGLDVGGWVAAQRVSYRSGRLAPKRVERLERLPGWTWSPREERWERNFAQLLNYVRRCRTARVPVAYADEDGKLGSWVHNQRCQHGRGTLGAERTRRLGELPG